jgi:hypothetical protein
MISSLKKLFYPIIALLAIGFVLFLFNQISTVYLAADQISPVLGWIVLSLLTLIVAGLMLVPLYHYFHLPKPLVQPSNEEELILYKKKLLARLKSNQTLKAKSKTPVSLNDLPVSMQLLDREADKIIKESASVIFLSTSISQNGKLDAFTVLAAQLRMVWKVSNIYYQRPSLREMLNIYGYVGASSFLANEIEDLDITRHIEPVASSLFKNASGKSVPLIGPAATIIMDSLLEGTTNAFLSLRVGILTKKYCGNLEVFDRKEIKKLAIKEAARQLKSVSVKASGNVIASLIEATKNAGLDTIKTGWENLKKTGSRVSSTFKTPFSKGTEAKATTDLENPKY